MEADDDTPRWLDDCRTLKVNLVSVSDFGVAIMEATERHFAPHAAVVKQLYANGVQFGAANPSGVVHAARLKYYDCLVAISQQLDSYVEASVILADAARTAAERYGRADALSHAHMRDLEQLLKQAAAARRPSEGAPAHFQHHYPQQRIP